MKNLTEEQILVLSEEFNLADGHAYRPLNAAEEAIIIADLPQIFRQVDRRQQTVIERDYIRTFLHAAGQSYAPAAFSHHMCFTASMGLEVVGNHLRLEQLSAALIEPCFDNLHDILARHGVPLTAFPDHWMQASPHELALFLQGLQVDVLFLVAPNNPTGTDLSRQNLQVVIDHCRRRQCLLVLDATFRFYRPSTAVYDQYAMLAEADIDCILIEDTGKTWPTKEIKAPFFSVSRRLTPRIAHIYSDFILHVSPVAVELLRRFVLLGTEQVHAVIAANRQALCEAISGSGFQLRGAGRMSVEWLQVAGPHTASHWQRLLAEQGLSVLTGAQFYWADHEAGECFLRIALQRDTVMFRLACQRLRVLLEAENAH